MTEKEQNLIWESYISEKKDDEKTVSKKADVDKDGKLAPWEKAKADKIAQNDDDPDTHACATKLEHAQFGVGTPIHARHAQPDANGNIAWYACVFEHGTEVVDTADCNVLDEMNHGNHGDD
mgnify:CR=1 FL=1